ncbi:hypothetical protein NDU88_010782 [Pleurodeles waltl]|uniref:Uncharacterized protein n=1 Tax=Pleurodeles waltl TaxID=8319 RepID=A0AAV7PW84_PLEWA|nr:hypothetical protein NDU88_010782 [Pleurodeles waltl]
MERNTLYTSKAEHLLHRLKDRNYEQGEKAGRLLVARLKQREAMTAIPAVSNPEGKLITETQAIANTFADYYTKLYSPEVDDDLLKEQELFDKITLPYLNEQVQLILAGEIKKDEITQGTSSLPYNKALGEDGFLG